MHMVYKCILYVCVCDMCANEAGHSRASLCDAVHQPRRARRTHQTQPPTLKHCPAHTRRCRTV